jgi:hypothetical protein
MEFLYLILVQVMLRILHLNDFYVPQISLILDKTYLILDHLIMILKSKYGIVSL